MEQEYIIAHADKTVLRISGLKIHGMDTRQVEELLEKKLHTFVRVIGRLQPAPGADRPG